MLPSFLIFASANLIFSNVLLKLSENDILAINEHEYSRILENKKYINLDENQVLGNDWQNKLINVLIAKTFWTV